MIDQVKSWALSAAALVAGIVCVIGAWSLVPREDDETVRNRTRFVELSGQEQVDLRNKATAFVDPANEPELIRLQKIHQVVSKDPSLLKRLESLDNLLSNLDPEAKARLNPDGEFAENWPHQVLELARQNNAGDERFEFPLDALIHWRFPGPDVVVSGTDYEAFLDRIADHDWGQNDEYLHFINGDDVDMRRMFKTLVLTDRLIETKSSDSSSEILEAARETFIPPGTERNEKLRKAIHQVTTIAASQPAEYRNIAASLSALKILDVGLRNTKRTFLAREVVTPEVFTRNFKRSEQVELMTMAADEAVQELKAKLVSDNSVENPQIARVNEILEQTRGRVRGRMRELLGELSQLKGFGNRSFFGGDRGPRRGRDDGGRGERGPGDRGPGRGSMGRRPEGPGSESGDRAEYERRRGARPGEGRGIGSNGEDPKGASSQPSASEAAR